MPTQSMSFTASKHVSSGLGLTAARCACLYFTSICFWEAITCGRARLLSALSPLPKPGLMTQKLAYLQTCEQRR